MSSAHRVRYISSFLIFLPFISLSCFIALARICNMVLNMSGKVKVDMLALFFILGRRYLVFYY